MRLPDHLILCFSPSLPSVISSIKVFLSHLVDIGKEIMCMCVCVCVSVCVSVCCTQLCPTLCYPMGCSLPGSSLYGIFQARILNRLPFPTPGDLLHPGIEPTSLTSPALAGSFFITKETKATIWTELGSQNHHMPP